MISNQLNRKPRILVVPFSWGLGHATRLIPVIHELNKVGADIFISGGPDQVKILKQEFQDIKILPLPYLRIRLSGLGSQIPGLALQVPGILISILREHYALRSLIRRESLDAVISDNCYGLWNKSVLSIFITHQLWIRLPGRIRWLERTINHMNHWFIRHYDLCWVPDYPGAEGYAGILSHKLPKRPEIRYLGILSRFRNFSETKIPEKSTKRKVLIILSGPEKQRSRFEKLIMDELPHIAEGYSIKIIRGLPSDKRPPDKNWYNHADAQTLFLLLRESDLIISRAGYSTVMDLLCLGKSAILVPTPGQTEQEYLAGILAEKGLFRIITQSEFILSKAIDEPVPDISVDFSGKNLLREEIKRFIELLDQSTS